MIIKLKFQNTFLCISKLSYSLKANAIYNYFPVLFPIIELIKLIFKRLNKEPLKFSYFENVRRIVAVNYFDYRNNIVYFK